MTGVRLSFCEHVDPFGRFRIRGVRISTDFHISIQRNIDQALINLWSVFNPNGIRSHLNNPDGVMNAEIRLPRSVISTTQNPLAMSSEQYHIAWYISCKSSLINGHWIHHQHCQIIYPSIVDTQSNVLTIIIKNHDDLRSPW